MGTHSEHEKCTDEYISAMQKRFCRLCPSLLPGSNVILWFRLEDKYKKRFPNIKSIHFVSCLSGKNLDNLVAGIQDIIATQECMGQPLPSNYLELERMIISEAKGKIPPIISWNDYKSLASLCLIEVRREVLKTNL